MSPSRLVYPAGKSAAIGVTRQMATDFGPMGIRVNAVCPGMVLTERLEALWGDNPSLVRFWGEPVSIEKNRPSRGHRQRHRIPLFQ